MTAQKGHNASRSRWPKPRPTIPGTQDAQSASYLRSTRWVLLVMGLIIGLMEIFQHLQLAVFELNLLFVAELVVYVVILPLAGFVILRQISRSEQAHRQASQNLTQQYALVRQLSGMSEWDELLSRVVELPHFFSPVSGTALYLRSADGSRYDLSAFWGEGADPGGTLPPVLPAEPAPGAGLSPASSTESGLQLYCLGLCLSDQPLGALLMLLPEGKALSPAQAETLQGIAVDMALVLDRAALRRVALSQAQANLAERQGIARNLHDTLAQNIAYLRLKLEEMVLEENPSRQIALIHNEISRMRDIADEAYHQVREAVADLHGKEQHHDLAQVLLERARTVGERAGFSAELLQRGAPHPLDAEIQRQAIYICREAINNIEKHSRCSKVALEIAWGEQALEVTVADNGRGFDLEQVDQRGHYGLTIMKERAAIVGGTLEVFSTLGESSTIALSLPYTPGRAPAAAVLNLQDAPEANLQADLAGPRPPSTPAGKV